MSFPLDSILSESSRSPFLKVIAAVLESVVRESPAHQPATHFDARRRPTVPLHDYLRRWMRYTRCGVVCVIVSVMLIDKVCMASGMPLTAINVHRFLLAALTTACKWHNDIPFLNSHYAQVGGVPIEELNGLERQLLMLLDFKLSVSAADLDTYVKMFRNHRAWPVDDEETEVVSRKRSTPRVAGLSPKAVTSESVDSFANTENGLSDTRSSGGCRVPVPPRASKQGMPTPRKQCNKDDESHNALPVIDRN
eukprot:Hpha_TRINITY_DN16295_c1_g1::TRINITY_DN16295_c1_g1_i1::g.14932::m.14932